MVNGQRCPATWKRKSLFCNAEGLSAKSASPLMSRINSIRTKRKQASAAPQHNKLEFHFRLASLKPPLNAYAQRCGWHLTTLMQLLFQRTNQYAEATDYWRRYLASDCQSEWAARARRSLKFCEMQLHLVASTGPTRSWHLIARTLGLLR
jgi:hypothetical protein